MPEIGSIQSPEGASDAAILRELQRKQQKQPVAKNGKTPVVRKSGYDALDKNSFLKLLVTQLSKQDPTNPMNDREFISQMAQFSSLEQMNNVANSMNKLRGAQANQLIGKMIEGKDFVTEKPLQGIVTSTIYQPNGDVLLKVGGRFTKLDDVSVVTEVTPAAAPVTAAGSGNVSRETLAPVISGQAPGDGLPRMQDAQLNREALPAQKPGLVPQADQNQAIKAYEANQKSAEKPAAIAPPTTQKNKLTVPKGE